MAAICAVCLCTLTLYLCDNEIGDAGAQALAMLKDSTTLRTLTLDLSDNKIGDAGAQALAQALHPSCFILHESDSILQV